MVSGIIPGPIPIDRIEHSLGCFITQERQNGGPPGMHRFTGGISRVRRRQLFVGIMIEMQRHPNLFEIVGAGLPPRSLPRGEQAGQNERHKHAAGNRAHQQNGSNDSADLGTPPPA